MWIEFLESLHPPAAGSIDKYLSSHSDIVALMVLEHQSDMHNLITAANYEARMALHYDDIMNQALERPEDYVSDSAKRRMDRAAEASSLRVRLSSI